MLMVLESKQTYMIPLPLRLFYFQAERDDALNRIRRLTKQVEKLTQQLMETKSQLTEVKAQLVEAAEHKVNHPITLSSTFGVPFSHSFQITSLERARKIDELSAKACDLENERTRLQTQLHALKERIRSMEDSSQDRRRRDEALIQVSAALFFFLI